MIANIIYKEIKSLDRKTISKIDIVEVEENEENAYKYAKLYNLQLPLDDRDKITYRIMSIAIS